jgi:hypothetical protein
MPAANRILRADFAGQADLERFFRWQKRAAGSKFEAVFQALKRGIRILRGPARTCDAGMRSILHARTQITTTNNNLHFGGTT